MQRAKFKLKNSLRASVCVALATESNLSIGCRVARARFEARSWQLQGRWEAVACLLTSKSRTKRAIEARVENSARDFLVDWRCSWTTPSHSLRDETWLQQLCSDLKATSQFLANLCSRRSIKRRLFVCLFSGSCVRKCIERRFLNQGLTEAAGLVGWSAARWRRSASTVARAKERLGLAWKTAFLAFRVRLEQPQAAFLAIIRRTSVESRANYSSSSFKRFLSEKSANLANLQLAREQKAQKELSLSLRNWVCTDFDISFILSRLFSKWSKAEQKRRICFVRRRQNVSQNRVEFCLRCEDEFSRNSFVCCSVCSRIELKLAVRTQIAQSCERRAEIDWVVSRSSKLRRNETGIAIRREKVATNASEVKLNQFTAQRVRKLRNWSEIGFFLWFVVAFDFWLLAPNFKLRIKNSQFTILAKSNLEKKKREIFALLLFGKYLQKEASFHQNTKQQTKLNNLRNATSR